MLKMKPKKYYIHALLGYSESTYTRRGPYRFSWTAGFAAHTLIANNPYGTATINKSPDKPLMVKD